MGSSVCGSLLAGGHYYGDFRRLSVILFVGFFFFSFPWACQLPQYSHLLLGGYTF